MRNISKSLLAGVAALSFAHLATAQEVEVLHWWTSGGKLRPLTS